MEIDETESSLTNGDETSSESKPESLSKQAKNIVQILEDVGGDIEAFAKKWKPHTQTAKAVSKALVVLYSAGSEDELDKWNLLIDCAKRAKLAIAEQKHIKALENMPVPTEDSPFKDHMAHANLWLADFKEESRNKGKQSGQKKDEGTRVPDDIRTLLEGLST
jgi:hypothetical protein